MANEEKSKGKKRLAEDESDGDSPKENKKSKFEDKIVEKSAKRRSDERRQNARFFAVCLTCYKFAISTIGEISDYAYSHMCEMSPETIDEDKNKSIVAFNEQMSLESSSTSAAEAKATTSSPPPPPPPTSYPFDK